jgi:hypothetical protein
VQALKERAAREPTRFTLIVPGTPHDDGHLPPDQRLAEAVEHLREQGLDIAGVVGDPNPAVAVCEVWDPNRYDEIVVSTLPLNQSRWLPAGLPQRVAQMTGAPVSHVVAHGEVHLQL